ncbi:MAG: efflux transporter outer membrane subunit [Burkholderiaceae bacterium]
MRLPLSLIPALAAAVLAGCATNPPPRPADPLPASYGKPETGAAAATDSRWWLAFGEARLDALIEQALANSSDLAIAITRVERADAVLREAGASLLPSLDAKGSGQRLGVGNVGASSFKLAASAAYELDFWGRNRSARNAAAADAQSARFVRDTVQLTLVSQVATTYLAARSLEAQLAASRTNLDLRDKAVQIASDRLAAGSASPLDLAQATSARAALAAQVSELAREREQVGHALALLVGVPTLELGGVPTAPLPVPPTPPAGLPSTLLTARPDVLAAEATLAAAAARVEVARAAFYPSISLTGSLGSESVALGQLFSAGIWSAGALIDLPLFDGGRRSARVDQASATQREAAELYRKTAETAYREVRDALAAVRHGRATEDARAQELGAARAAARIAQARYEAGASAFIELLEAQRSVNEASIGWLRARQARLAAVVDLNKALGQGWQGADRAPQPG